MSLPKLKENKEKQSKIDFFKKQMWRVLLINEVFDTIQCEGKSMWNPVVFIRTYGCNLRCGFANPTWERGCDTPYTWKPSETKESDKNKYTPEMLVKEILQYNSHNHWVITGGEPLLQGNKFIEVIEEYKKETGNYPYIEIETNWTIIPSKELDKYIWHYNVSVKLENSNATEKTGYTPDEMEYNWNTKERRIKEDAINFFNNSEKSYFKFVIDKKLEVLEEIKELQKEFNIKNEKVWLMPEGNSPEDINENSDPLIEICKKEWYKFTTRLHILIWGYERGK